MTHLFDLPYGWDTTPPDTLFLHAPREQDGTRTFRLEPGVPERTSYGLDLYQQVFGTTARRDPAPTTTNSTADRTQRTE